MVQTDERSCLIQTFVRLTGHYPSHAYLTVIRHAPADSLQALRLALADLIHLMSLCDDPSSQPCVQVRHCSKTRDTDGRAGL